MTICYHRLIHFYSYNLAKSGLYCDSNTYLKHIIHRDYVDYLYPMGHALYLFKTSTTINLHRIKEMTFKF